MKFVKGIALAEVIMWGAALAASGALAFGGYVNTKVSNIEEKNTSIVQRVAIVETNNTNQDRTIFEINIKLDKLNDNLTRLLIANGVQPIK